MGASVNFYSIGGQPFNFYSRPPTVDSNTVLYLNFEGSDGSTTIIDDTGRHTVTAVGNAEIDTAQAAVGSSSGLTVSTAGYFLTSDSDDFYVGTGDFTFDTYVRYNSFINTNPDIFFRQSDLVGEHVFQIQNNGTRFAFQWQIDNSNSSSVNWDLPTMNVGQWYYVALVKSGTNISCYLDNVALTPNGAYTASQLSNLSGPLIIGGYDTVAHPSYFHDGWLDGVRWSNIARTPGQPINFYSR